MVDADKTKPASLPPPKKGLARLMAATGYSADGLRAALKNEEAVRLEFAAFAVLAPLGLWLGETTVEKVLLVACLVLVLLVELLNTAIEAVVDRIGPDYHELSKKAKDTGSAAVLISLCLVVFTWGMLLLS